MDWRGPGNGPRTTLYQTMICNSSGILRKISTYPAASLAITQFLDSRMMPTMKPRMVAKKMPMADRTRVLKSPTMKAVP